MGEKETLLSNVGAGNKSADCRKLDRTHLGEECYGSWNRRFEKAKNIADGERFKAGNRRST